MRCVAALLSLLIAPLAFAQGVLHVYNWNNYIAPQTLERFREQCHCRVAYDTYGSNDELLAKLALAQQGMTFWCPRALRWIR